ncbi:MAG: BamA/TamA family outer membrane protein [Balneolaceae bacterium]
MRTIFWLSFLIGISLSGEFLYAQNVQNNVSESEEDKVVRKVRFTGNDNVNSRTLKTLVRTRNNREFLGIPRFTPWYYIWQVFGVGESPTLLDREMVANDMERISIYYENLGFFEVEVDTTIAEYRTDRVEVSFLISEGPQTYIRSVAYTGLPGFEEPGTSDNFYSRSIFSGNAVNDTTFEVNQKYRAQTLREEQTRVITFLKNNGYAATQRDSVQALLKRDETDPHILDVLFSINPGDLYIFGDVFINLAGPDGTNVYDDSLRAEGDPYTEPGFQIFMQRQNSAQTKFGLLTDQIQFTPGNTFNQSLYLRSVNSYQNLGMMLINRFGLNEESSLPDYSKREIPVYFDLQTIPKHSVRGEFFGMRRYGFGTGFGVNYNNNNMLGRAENLSLGLNTSLEFVPSETFREISPPDQGTTTGSTTFQSYEVRAEYALPRLNFPFHFLSDNTLIESSRTRYSLTYSQSNQLYFDINSDIRFNLQYEITHTPRFISFIDLIELDIVDTDPSQQFRENLIREFGDGSIELQRIEEDFRPQFSSILRYTLRHINTNLIKRNRGYFGEYSVSIAGNMPYFLDRYGVTPGEIEGTLPSPLGISSNALAYSRFVKLSADFRRYIPLSSDAVFALRLFAGIAQPYGGSETIPLSRRFFAGGSNDIRGWSPFRLGPGGISGDEVTVPGGEIKLAAFTELRQIFMSDIIGAQWHIAWHTDAGNVWYGPRNTFRDEEDVEILEDGKFFFDSFYNQIAVGSGLGLRLDWDFIVARFDFTMRVHDLEQGWFNNQRLYFSFGIGHSF